jgi:hypothetical protein
MRDVSSIIRSCDIERIKKYVVIVCRNYCTQDPRTANDRIKNPNGVER